MRFVLSTFPKTNIATMNDTTMMMSGKTKMVLQPIASNKIPVMVGARTGTSTRDRPYHPMIGPLLSGGSIVSKSTCPKAREFHFPACSTLPSIIRGKFIAKRQRIRPTMNKPKTQKV